MIQFLFYFLVLKTAVFKRTARVGKVVSSAHAFDPYVFPVRFFFSGNVIATSCTRILAAAYFPDEQRRHKDASIDRNGGKNEGFMHGILNMHCKHRSDPIYFILPIIVEGWMER
jgi:hypothetical protein